MAVKQKKDGSKIIMKEGGDGDVALRLFDMDGNQVFSNNLHAATMTLYVLGGDAIGTADRDITANFHAEDEKFEYFPDENGDMVSVAVSAMISLTPADNAIVNTTSREKYEIHVMHLEITPDNPRKVFPEDIWIHVENLKNT